MTCVWVLIAGSCRWATSGLGDSIAREWRVPYGNRENRARISCGCVRLKPCSAPSLGTLAVNDAVNLEKALTLETRLGGHLVSGHVDGVGTVTARREDSRSVRFSVQAPDELARYIAIKGSICVDGVSLTVNAVDGAGFELNIVPHTLVETTLRDYREGRQVNLEVDLVARYLERLLQGDAAAQPGPGGQITRELLESCGFSGK